MQLKLLGQEQDICLVQEGTRLLLEDIDLRSACETLEISLEFTESDVLSAERNGTAITITCKEPAHYFRGLNWALHNLQGQTASKTETSCFKTNGMMLDVSRNCVATVEKLKSFIRTQARMGLNMLMLYTEETYEIPEEPYFGAYRGRYTQEELREVDAYAKLFGITLIPCIQTLAHLRNALKWPSFHDVRDTDDILLVGEEKVYALIENMLRSVKASFTTNRVHLGMDEAAKIGLGEYLAKNGYKNKAALIKEHCARVLAICRKLNLEPMIWSDMYLYANTGEWYYYECDLSQKADLVKPEKDMGLIYWDYYHDREYVYDYMLKNHKVLSDNVLFAGGAWIWNGLSPNYSHAYSTQIPSLAVCKKHNIQEVFCTAWQDNGSETPLDAVLPGMVLWAHLGFHEELDKQLLKEEFCQCADGELEDFCQLEYFDALFVGVGKNVCSDNPSKYLLYQDALLGMFDAHLRGVDTKTWYADLAQKLAACQKTSPAHAKLFRYYELLALVLSQKADLGVRIKAAYDSGDMAALQTISQKTIPWILAHLRDMKDMRQDLWMESAKPFGYELMDIKLGGVLTRLESAQRRLNAYIAGAVTALEELEHPRLPFFQVENAAGHPTSQSMNMNLWDRIVSGCNLYDVV